MRLFSAFLIQVCREKREELLEYALAGGHGVEVADFALPEVVNNAGKKKRLRAWYAGSLAGLKAPVSLHAPFVDILPASGDRLVQQAARRRLAESLDIAEEIGASYAVVHTGFDPMVMAQRPGYGSEWVQRHGEFWAEALEGRRARLLFENMWEADPALFIRLTEATRALRTAVCLDVGHANLRPSPSAAEWVEALGGRIACLHLHDNRRRRDNHLPPGQGTLDWGRLAAALGKLPRRPLAVPEVVGLPALREAMSFLASLEEGRRGPGGEA